MSWKNEVLSFSPKSKSRWEINNRGTAKGQISSPIGVTFLKNNQLGVAELNNGRVQIFNDLGGSAEIVGKGHVKPRDVATDPATNNVAIVDERDKTVKIFTARGERDAFWKRELLEKPNGIAISTHGFYVITDLAGDVRKIWVYDPEGNEITSFGKAERCSMDVFVKTPTYVACDTKGRILVSDWTTSCVRVFEQSGKEILKFGSYGDQDDQFKYPSGIAVDSKDNILVADNGNSRVSMFSSSGKFMKHVVGEDDGLSWPEALSVNSAGLLAVTQSGIETDSVKVYEL